MPKSDQYHFEEIGIRREMGKNAKNLADLVQMSLRKITAYSF